MANAKRTFGNDAEIKKSVGSQLIEGLTEFADALEAGNVEQFTFHRVKLNLEPTHYSPGLVKKTRNAVRASQAVFGGLLGVSANTVRAWEQGVNPPNNMARRFMDVIRSDPRYWIEQLKKLVIVAKGKPSKARKVTNRA